MKKMSDLVKIIIRQTEILFKNLNAQIERCNLDAEIDGIQNARYLFHAIHSLDKWFINPETFCEPDKTVTGGTCSSDYNFCSFDSNSICQADSFSVSCCNRFSIFCRLGYAVCYFATLQPPENRTADERFENVRKICPSLSPLPLLFFFYIFVRNKTD